MWPFKSRCPEGTIHVWEYDGQFFKTEEAKKEYIFRKREEDLKEKFFHVIEGAIRNSHFLGEYSCVTQRLSTSEKRMLAVFFYNNSKLFYDALRLEAQRDNEKGN